MYGQVIEGGVGSTELKRVDELLGRLEYCIEQCNLRREIKLDPSQAHAGSLTSIPGTICVQEADFTHIAAVAKQHLANTDKVLQWALYTAPNNDNTQLVASVFNLNGRRLDPFTCERGWETLKRMYRTRKEWTAERSEDKRPALVEVEMRQILPGEEIHD